MGEIVDIKELLEEAEQDDLQMDLLSHALFDVCLRAARHGVTANELIKYISFHYPIASRMVANEDTGGDVA